MRPLDHHVGNDDAIAESKCPKCGAAKGSPCVYITPTASSIRYMGKGSTYQRQLERAGKPTKRVHNERSNAALLRRRTEWLRASRPAITPLPPQRFAAMAAVRQWETNEQIKLRDWLAKYGPILWGKP